MAIDQVQEQLDTLAVRLGLGLTIDSVSGELLAYSPQHDDTDPARISSILLRHVAPNVRAWQERHIAASTQEPIPVPANPELGMSARLCLPLRRAGRTLAYLWLLTPETELSAAQRAALRKASEALAGLLDIPSGAQPKLAGHGRESDQLIRLLLEDGQVDAYHQLTALVPGLTNATVQLVAVVAVTSADPQRPAVRALCPTEFSSLSRALGPSLRANHDHLGCYVCTAYALLLRRYPGARHDTGDLLNVVDEVLTHCLTTPRGSAIGISEPVPFGPRSVLNARSQALACAELSALDPTLNRRCGWADLGPYRNLIDSKLAPSAALTPLEQAGPAAPALIETLETYLDLGGNAQATASLLCLHRSSLYYRLDRISQLLEADLSDGLVRLELHLELKRRRIDRRTLHQF